jgi:hypothetical protein
MTSCGASLGKSFFPSGIVFPGGVKVVFPPYGVIGEVWIPVLAYDSLSYMTKRASWPRYIIADIAWSPMSIAPPSPAMTTMLGSLPLYFPLRIRTL